MFFFVQSASSKRHCVTHCEQRGMNSCQQWQIVVKYNIPLFRYFYNHLSNYTKTVIRLRLVNIGECSPRLRLGEYLTIIPRARVGYDYALVGYNHFISNKGEWNNCFSKFSNRVLPPIFISTILQSENCVGYGYALVGYNHFISNKGEWNNCFSKFSNRVLPPIFISTIFTKRKLLNLAHYFPYDAKLRILAHSRSFLANQKARNTIFGAENLLITNIHFAFGE